MNEDALANAYYIQWVSAAAGLVVAALAASVHELFFPNTVRIPMSALARVGRRRMRWFDVALCVLVLAGVGYWYL